MQKIIKATEIPSHPLLHKYFHRACSLFARSQKIKNRTFKTPGDSFFFNGGVSLIWIVILFFWSLFSKDCRISPEAVIYGIIYGVILCLFLYFKTQSMASGPVSLTTLIGSSAFIIATWFGVIYAAEEVNRFQLVGMALILLSLILCVNPKKSAEPLTLKWFLYCFAFFVAGGLVGILYKVFGKSGAADQVNAMMLTAAIVSALLFFVMGFLVNRVASVRQAPSIHKGAVFYIVFGGIAGCIYIRLNIPLASMIPSAIFFPVSNGAMVVLTTLAGGVIFKEKLNGIQKAGILLGLIAIIITGNFLWNLIR